RESGREKHSPIYTTMSIPSIFSTITHGVYIVTVVSSEAAGRATVDRSTSGHGAFTASGITHVSFHPLLIALCINHQHSSYKLLRESILSAVPVVPKDRVNLFSNFARRPPEGKNKLKKSTCSKHAEHGAPIVEDCISSFECKA